VDRIFLHCPGVNDSFSGDELEDGAFDEAGIFHFGYPPLMRQFWLDGGTRLAKLLTRARAGGALTSLDMSLPDPASPSGKADWPGVLRKALPCVDVFAPSVEELLFMMDRPLFDRLAVGGGEAIVRGITFRDLGRLSAEIIARGVSAVLIKLGDRGAYLRTGPQGLAGLPLWAGREIYSPCFTVPAVVGTTGSGDATIAGFLGAIQKGLDPASALRMAVAVGACCVEAPDATSGVRSWEETLSRVSAGWKRADSAPGEPGWTPTNDGAWRGPGDPHGSR
jgi:sugar/nucleoside kinase (ribokinase family)